MDGYVVEHINDAVLALMLDPRGQRVGQKVFFGPRDKALRLATEEDAKMLGETFAPGSFRVMPAKQRAAAELRVLDAEKPKDPAEAASERFAGRAASRKSSAGKSTD